MNDWTVFVLDIHLGVPRICLENGQVNIQRQEKMERDDMGKHIVWRKQGKSDGRNFILRNGKDSESQLSHCH